MAHQNPTPKGIFLTYRFYLRPSLSYNAVKVVNYKPYNHLKKFIKLYIYSSLYSTQLSVSVQICISGSSCTA